jgi:hypothetical protein
MRTRWEDRRQNERKLLKAADQMSKLLVAARNRCEGQGNLLKMISNASRLIDWNWSWSRADMIALSFAFLQWMEVGWE